MLVTSNLEHDPRVTKEALLAHESEYDVLVICRSYRGRPKPYKVDAINIDHGRTRLDKYLERVRLNMEMVKRGREFAPHIVHANDLDTLPAAYAIARSCGAKLVYDSHELWIDSGLGVGGVGRKLAYLMEKFVIRRADAVVTVSSFIARKLQERYGIPLPVVVMNTPPYVDPAGLERRSWLDQFRGKFVVLYQGRYAPDLLLKEMICAAHYVDDRVIFALRGVGEYEAELRETIRQEGLEDRVFVLPPVSMDELVEYAFGADVGVSPLDKNNLNHRLSIGNRIFTYPMALLPSLTANVESLRPLISDSGIGLLFESGSPQDLGRKIMDLVDQPELLARLRENCRQFSKEYCWEKEGGKLIGVYASLLGQPKPVEDRVGHDA